MSLIPVNVGDAHVAAHNAERNTINNAVASLPPNVKTLYAATGDGVTDDTAAINAAINAANAAYTAFGIQTEVVVPPGIYKINSTVTIKAGVQLRLAAGATLRAGGTTAAPVVVLSGATDAALIGPGTIDANSRTNTTAIVVDTGSSATMNRAVIRDVRVMNSVVYCISVAVRARGLRIENCNFENSAAGVTFFNIPGDTVRDIIVRGCRFLGITTNNLQVYSGSTPTPHSYIGVVLENNFFHDYGSTSAIPLEVGGCDNVMIRGNYIGPGSQLGISTGNNYDLSIVANTIRGQIGMGIELGNNKQFVISANTIHDCETWMMETGAQAEDGLIVGNQCIGTGLSSATTNGGIFMPYGARRIRIVANLFSDWQYKLEAIHIGQSAACQDITVAENTFIINDAHTPAKAITVESAIRVTIRANTIRCKRQITSADDADNLILYVVGNGLSDILIIDNDLIYSGGSSGATAHAGIGNNGVAPSTATGIVIRRNLIRYGVVGIRVDSTSSADLVIEDNDTTGCTVASERIHANTVYRRSLRRVEATAAPTAGTWAVGDRAFNRTPAVGSPKGWICTVAGTPGTWVSEGNL